MALIYTKSAEKTLILSPREFFKRQFDFGDDWTEMRMGMYFSAVSAADDNANSVSETVALSTASDRITFGLKNFDTDDLPGEAGSIFVGASNQTGQSSAANTVGYYSNGVSGFTAVTFNGATLVSGGSSGDSLHNFSYMECPGDVSVSSDYCGFFALKFEITDRGLSSQSIDISLANDTSVAGSDYSPTALRTDMNNATYNTPVTVAWNDGSAAYDIPDAYYIRLPFFNNRIRLSCIRALRYA